MNDELIVRATLEELRQMFPDEEWFEARETQRYTPNGHGSFGEVVVGYEAFRAATLHDVMILVRAFNESQAKEQSS